MKSCRPSPNQLVVLGFVGAILAGMALPKLPAVPGDVSRLDAPFEATSAVTVTGLRVAGHRGTSPSWGRGFWWS